MGTLGLYLNYTFLREALFGLGLGFHRVVIGVSIGLLLISQLIPMLP